jgi:hypothetical protein
MSGYDPHTGWTHFTSTKVSRYHRAIEGQPDDLTARLNAIGADWYCDASGGLHVRCDDGQLWEILSGKPSTFTSATETDPKDEEEWINVTDIGAALAVPPLGTSTVLRLLREAGLLQRKDGRDVPTEAAVGLFEERPVEGHRASRFPSRPSPGAVQRRWAYRVLVMLRERVSGTASAQGWLHVH